MQKEYYINYITDKTAKHNIPKIYYYLIKKETTALILDISIPISKNIKKVKVKKLPSELE